MAVDPGALTATLAAFAGDDAALAAELRAACLESLDAGIAALTGARDVADWNAALDRIEGVSASFGALRLMRAAQDAGVRPLDGRAAAGVARIVARLHGSGPVPAA